MNDPQQTMQGQSEVAPTSTPIRMDDDVWIGNIFSLYSCPIANHNGTNHSYPSTYLMATNLCHTCAITSYITYLFTYDVYPTYMGNLARC